MYAVIKLILKTIIIYLSVTIGIRCMGKRQMGELSTTEMSVTLLISEVAATPIMERDIPVYHGIIAVVVFVLLELILSYFDLKFPFMVRLTQGEPTVLVKDGYIDEKALRQSRVTIAELNEELRLKNIMLSEVYIAIIETNGQLSIIPKPSQSGATRADLNIKSNTDPIDFAVIVDGEIKENNLKLIGKNKEFVYSIMKAKGIEKISDVFVMYCDKKGVTYLQLKEKR